MINLSRKVYSEARVAGSFKRRSSIYLGFVARRAWNLGLVDTLPVCPPNLRVSNELPMQRADLISNPFSLESQLLSEGTCVAMIEKGDERCIYSTVNASQPLIQSLAAARIAIDEKNPSRISGIFAEPR
jgi:hypothetical protein